MNRYVIVYDWDIQCDRYLFFICIFALSDKVF